MDGWKCMAISSISTTDSTLPDFEIYFVMLESSIEDFGSTNRQVYATFGILALSTKEFQFFASSSLNF